MAETLPECSTMEDVEAWISRKIGEEDAKDAETLICCI